MTIKVFKKKCSKSWMLKDIVDNYFRIASASSASEMISKSSLSNSSESNEGINWVDDELERPLPEKS